MESLAQKLGMKKKTRILFGESDFDSKHGQTRRKKMSMTEDDVAVADMESTFESLSFDWHCLEEVEQSCLRRDVLLFQTSCWKRRNRVTVGSVVVYYYKEAGKTTSQRGLG